MHFLIKLIFQLDFLKRYTTIQKSRKGKICNVFQRSLTQAAFIWLKIQ